MSTHERIILEHHAGCERPYVAILQVQEEGWWVEEDAMTGSTRAESLRDLREINPRARNAEVLR